MPVSGYGKGLPARNASVCSFKYLEALRTSGFVLPDLVHHAGASRSVLSRITAKLPFSIALQKSLTVAALPPVAINVFEAAAVGEVI